MSGSRGRTDKRDVAATDSLGTKGFLEEVIPAGHFVRTPAAQSTTIPFVSISGKSFMWSAEAGGIIRGRNNVTGMCVALSPSTDVVRLRKHSEVSSMLQVGGAIWVGCTDSSIIVFDGETASQVGEFSVSDFPAWALYADGRGSVCIGSGDGNIYRVDEHSLSLEEVLRGHRGAVRCMTGNTSVLVSASEDCTVKVWEHALTLRMTLLGHTAAVLCVCVVGPVMLSSSADATIRCWDFLGSGDCIHVIRQHRGPVPSLLFNDGEFKVWSVGHDGRIFTWDPTTFALLQELPPQGGALTSATAVSQCTVWRVWTSGADGTVSAWMSTCADSREDEGVSAIRELRSEIEDKVRVIKTLEREIQSKAGRSFTDDQVKGFLRTKKQEVDEVVLELEANLQKSEERNLAFQGEARRLRDHTAALQECADTNAAAVRRLEKDLDLRRTLRHDRFFELEAHARGSLQWAEVQVHKEIHHAQLLESHHIDIIRKLRLRLQNAFVSHVPHDPYTSPRRHGALEVDQKERQRLDAMVSELEERYAISQKRLEIVDGVCGEQLYELKSLTSKLRDMDDELQATRREKAMAEKTTREAQSLAAELERDLTEVRREHRETVAKLQECTLRQEASMKAIQDELRTVQMHLGSTRAELEGKERLLREYRAKAFETTVAESSSEVQLSPNKGSGLVQKQLQENMRRTAEERDMLYAQNQSMMLELSRRRKVTEECWPVLVMEVGQEERPHEPLRVLESSRVSQETVRLENGEAFARRDQEVRPLEEKNDAIHGRHIVSPLPSDDSGSQTYRRHPQLYIYVSPRRGRDGSL